MSVTLEVSKLSGWLNADGDAEENISLMPVTLEVSKLSGRLNAYASCAGSKEGACGSWRDAGRTAGGRGVLAATQAARTRRVQLKAAWGHDLGRGAEYREAGGGGRPRCKRRAGEGSTADWGQVTGRSARRSSDSCL